MSCSSRLASNIASWNSPTISRPGCSSTDRKAAKQIVIKPEPRISRHVNHCHAPNHIRRKNWASTTKIPLFPRITYSPDRIRRIVSYQQRAVRSHRHPDRTPPNLSIGKHEAGEKVLVFAACLSRLMQGHADDFVSHADAPVPRAMLRREDVALIFRGKLLTLVERHFE